MCTFVIVCSAEIYLRDTYIYNNIIIKRNPVCSMGIAFNFNSIAVYRPEVTVLNNY